MNMLRGAVTVKYSHGYFVAVVVQLLVNVVGVHVDAGDFLGPLTNAGLLIEYRPGQTQELDVLGLPWRGADRHDTVRHPIVIMER